MKEGRRLGELAKLLRERRLPVTGALRLPFARHVNHLDADRDYPSGYHRLKSKPRPCPPLDGPMILLNAIVEIGALSNPDRPHLAPRSILESVCSVAGHESLPVGLATVNDDLLGPATALECLAQDPLGRSEISPFAEPKINGIAVAVDSGALQVPPVAADLDVCLINMPFARHRSLALIECSSRSGA